MREYPPCRRVRMRAGGVILSHQGCSVQEIACIFEVCRQTVSSWFDDWEKHGMTGLYDKPRSGHPPIWNDEDADFVMYLIEEEACSTKTVVALLEERIGKKVSVYAVERILKKRKFKGKKGVHKPLKHQFDE